MSRVGYDGEVTPDVACLDCSLPVGLEGSGWSDVLSSVCIFGPDVNVMLHVTGLCRS